jgi:hypothetical protein
MISAREPIGSRNGIWTRAMMWKITCYDMFIIYRDVTSARSCNKVGHLFWFTILAQHETNDVILYIHSVHKHRGNSFQRQNYKMRLKQRSLNWINSMQVKKILFTNVFFSWSLCLLNVSIDGIPQAFLFFRFVDINVITVHDRFWNVGQSNCILKYFENMMIDHSDSTIF